MLNARCRPPRKVEKAGLTIDDIDLFEINEVVCRRRRHRSLGPQARSPKVNVNGAPWRWPSDRCHGARSSSAPCSTRGPRALRWSASRVVVVTMCPAAAWRRPSIIERT
ncbi:MAG: hypothetical protein R2710_05575 [Acidimicrobiales bacterium]